MNHNVVQPLLSLLVPIDELTPDPRNARTHSEANIKAVKESLTESGQRFPIVVQKNGMIVRAGNARLIAAKELGWTHIAAVVVDEPDTEAIKFAIRDNKTALLADWDYEILAEHLKELEVTEYDLAQLGFEQHELDVVLHAEWAPPLRVDEEVQTKNKGHLVHVHFTAEEFQTAHEAIEKLKAQNPDEVPDDVTDGQCLQIICKEFLSR